jgi:hypothetical protein
LYYPMIPNHLLSVFWSRKRDRLGHCFSLVLLSELKH